MLKMPKRHLLLLAGSLWAIAGYQILHIGVSTIQHEHWPIFCILFSASIILFLFLRFVFLNMVKKHTQRISSMSEERQPFYYFFDKKSYLIMAIMMSGGILLRQSSILPNSFIAFFYTGLGTALLISGILFLREWLHYQNNHKNICTQ